MQLTRDKVARTIDHTFLRPDGSLLDIKRLCAEAKKYNFAGVAVAPSFVEIAAEKLAGTDINVVVGVGFPLGYSTTSTKIFEAKDLIKKGANEIDMMVNIGAVKDKRWDYVKKEIAAVAEVSKEIIFKVIFETCYLTVSEIKKLAEICLEIEEVDFIKTSTGFGTAGATVETVRLMKETVGNKIKVKAAGGIQSLQDYIKMVEAGASRIGTSSSVHIINELAKSNN